MRKSEFLQALRQHLAALPSGEVEDILRDQEEFINDAIHAGKTEEQAVASLGDPKAFASNLTAEMKIKSAEESATLGKQVSLTFGAVFALLALFPLNLIFVLGPFLGLVGILIGAWATSFGLFAAAWGGFFAFLFKLLFVSAGFWAHVSTFFFVLALIGTSLICMILMYHVTRFFIQGTLAYLKWNMNFIKGFR